MADYSSRARSILPFSSRGTGWGGAETVMPGIASASGSRASEMRKDSKQRVFLSQTIRGGALRRRDGEQLQGGENGLRIAGHDDGELDP